MNESLHPKLLLVSRERRLAKLLRMSAPHSIIAEECLLVIRAYAGGSRWDSLRFVLRDILRRGETIVRSRAELIACRVIGMHTWGAVLDDDLEETGLEECCYCNERREIPCQSQT